MDYNNLVNASAAIINACANSHNRSEIKMPLYYFYGRGREIVAREIARLTRRYPVTIHASSQRYARKYYNISDNDLILLQIDPSCRLAYPERRYEQAMDQLYFAQNNRTLPIIMLSRFSPEEAFGFKHGSQESVLFRINYRVVDMENEVTFPNIWN